MPNPAAFQGCFLAPYAFTILTQLFSHCIEYATSVFDAFRQVAVSALQRLPWHSYVANMFQGDTVVLVVVAVFVVLICLEVASVVSVLLTVVLLFSIATESARCVANENQQLYADRLAFWVLVNCWLWCLRLPALGRILGIWSPLAFGAAFFGGEAAFFTVYFALLRGITVVLACLSSFLKSQEVEEPRAALQEPLLEQKDLEANHPDPPDPTHPEVLEVLSGEETVSVGEETGQISAVQGGDEDQLAVQGGEVLEGSHEALQEKTDSGDQVDDGHDEESEDIRSEVQRDPSNVQNQQIQPIGFSAPPESQHEADHPDPPEAPQEPSGSMEPSPTPRPSEPHAERVAEDAEDALTGDGDVLAGDAQSIGGAVGIEKEHFVESIGPEEEALQALSAASAAGAAQGGDAWRIVEQVCSTEQQCQEEDGEDGVSSKNHESGQEPTGQDTSGETEETVDMHQAEGWGGAMARGWESRQSFHLVAPRTPIKMHQTHSDLIKSAFFTLFFPTSVRQRSPAVRERSCSTIRTQSQLLHRLTMRKRPVGSDTLKRA